jgi:RNA polymerase sigma-70 factor (ECF subfamily)
LSEWLETKSQQEQADTVSEFTRIIDNFQRRLVALAYRMLGNYEDARDFVQEAFLKLWKTGRWQEGGQEMFSFVAKILVNLCIDRLRKQKLRQFFSISEILVGQSKDNPEQEIFDGELQEMLELQVERLKPRQKAIFILRDVEGYSVKETARMVGCSENSVLTNLHLARHNLRKWLKPYLQE